jgi:predicted nucleic acid-binding protein
MPVEVVHLLRRGALSGGLSEDMASQAQEEVLRLPVVLFPYEPFAARVWQLRHSVTPYDAWYVAMAEALGAPLGTLDSRLAAASGPTCTFVRAPPR